MKIPNMIILLVKITLNLVFIQHLSAMCLSKSKRIRYLIIFVLISLNYGVEIVFVDNPVLIFTLNTLMFFTLLIFKPKKEKLESISIILFSFTTTDIIQISAAFLSSPILLINNGNIRYETAATLALIIFIILGILVRIFLLRNAETIFTSNSQSAKIGICIICGFVEGIFIQLKMQEYEEKNEPLYFTLTIFIAFCCVILFFWIWDKKEELKKIRELTSYAHKTSEVIPTIHQIIKDNELVVNNEKALTLMNELQSVCESDLKEVQQENKRLKTFASTGCIMLDKQLTRYLEEAERQNFQLDIIVQASTDQILKEHMLDVKGLIQIVGDLYKNARKAIKVEKSRKNILICFGFLSGNKYQISVFDTGIPFPNKVLKNFGTRGMTTNGTGNGLADIRKSLKMGNASIILNQHLPQGSIFTKEVRIVFDGLSNIEIE